MLDIETQNLKQLGLISRPFSSQLKARTLGDTITEFIASRTGKIQTVNYPVVGVDISYWQGSIDFGRLASKIYFAFVRAGRGNSDVDSLYSTNLGGLHRYGRAIGLYWYMMPRTGTNFRQHVDSFVPRWRDSGSQLPPVFDIEENGGMNKTDLTAWIQKAVARFEDATNVSPMIYTSAGFWNGNTYRNDWAKTLKLWVAHWTSLDNPLIPNDWGAISQPKTWDYWQHAVLPNGVEYGVSSQRLDHNRYHYSLAVFNSTYKMALPPLGDVPPPVPSDIIKPMYLADVTATTLNVRAGAGDEFSDIGNLPLNTRIPVVSESGDWRRIDGFVHKDYIKKI